MALQPGLVPALPRPAPPVVEDTGDRLDGSLWLAEGGALRCRSPRSLRVLPATLALWMPRSEPHQVEPIGATRLRRVDLALSRSLASAAPLPGRVAVAGPLLAALAGSLEDTAGERAEDRSFGSASGEPASRRELTRALIRDEFEGAQMLAIGLPLPRSGRLRHAAELAIAGAAGDGGLQALADAVGAHPRSLARALRREVGLSYGDWRAQLRLARMVMLWAQGLSLGESAPILGYATPSALSYMVRQVVGMTPTRLLGADGRSAVRRDARRAGMPLGPAPGDAGPRHDLSR